MKFLHALPYYGHTMVQCMTCMESYIGMVFWWIACYHKLLCSLYDFNVFIDHHIWLSMISLFFVWWWTRAYKFIIVTGHEHSTLIGWYFLVNTLDTDKQSFFFTWLKTTVDVQYDAQQKGRKGYRLYYRTKIWKCVKSVVTSSILV